MSSHINDRWLWLGFGVFISLAAWQIRVAMREHVNLILIDPAQYDQNVEIPSFDNHDRKLDPEESISVETLRTLVCSPNVNIANAATSLVIARLQPHLFGNKINLVTKDLLSRDESTRQKARTALQFLRDWDSDFAGLPLPQGVTPTSGGVESMAASTDGVIRPMTGAEVEHIMAWGPESLDSPQLRSVEIPSATSPIAGWTNVPRERPFRAPLNDDATQLEQRRWRREAMVLHGGEDGAIDENDVMRSNGHL